MAAISSQAYGYSDSLCYRTIVLGCRAHLGQTNVMSGLSLSANAMTPRHGCTHSEHYLFRALVLINLTRSSTVSPAAHRAISRPQNCLVVPLPSGPISKTGNQYEQTSRTCCAHSDGLSLTDGYTSRAPTPGVIHLSSYSESSGLFTSLAAYTTRMRPY